MMDHVGERLIWYYVPFTDTPIPGGGVDVVTVANTVLAMAVAWGLLWFAGRKRAWIPGRAQMLLEAIIGSFIDLIESSIQDEARETARRILPLVLCLFLFVLVSNTIVLLPGVHIEEPTSDLNCTLGLALVSMTYVTYSGLRARGVRGYVNEMLGPLWPEEGANGPAALLGRLSALLFGPLHLVGELSRVASLSLRLFGNIMGAATITLVITVLSFGILAPLVLLGFFAVFEAAVQAFVFATLTTTYIAVASE